MGGCASKPKESNCAPATLPGENPNIDSTPKNVEVDTPAQVYSFLIFCRAPPVSPQKEEPLVDLSEPAAPKEEGEAVSAEPKNAAIDDLVSGIVAQPTVEDVTAKQTEEKVEAGNQTTQQIKDEPVVANLAEKTTETTKSNDAGDAQVATSATAEKKNDEPIVHV